MLEFIQPENKLQYNRNPDSLALLMTAEQWDSILALVRSCNVGRVTEVPEQSLGDRLFGTQAPPPPPDIPAGWLDPVIAQIMEQQAALNERIHWQTRIDAATLEFQQLLLEVSASDAGDDLLLTAKSLSDAIDPDVQERFDGSVSRGPDITVGLNLDAYKAARSRLSVEIRKADRRLEQRRREERFHVLEDAGAEYFFDNVPPLLLLEFPSELLECTIFRVDETRPGEYKAWHTVEAVLGLLMYNDRHTVSPELNYEGGYIGFSARASGKPPQVFLFLIDGEQCFTKGYGAEFEVQALRDSYSSLLAEVQLSSMLAK